jgi:hypothetical protein
MVAEVKLRRTARESAEDEEHKRRVKDAGDNLQVLTEEFNRRERELEERTRRQASEDEGFLTDGSHDINSNRYL